MFVGFGVTSLVLNYGRAWTSAFHFMAIWNFAVMLCVMIVPRKYYNLDEAIQAKRDHIQEMRIKLRTKPEAGGTGLESSGKRPHEQVENTRPVVLATQATNDVEMISTISSIMFKDKSYCDRICHLLSNSAYVMIVLTSSCLFYIVTGL